MLFFSEAVIQDSSVVVGEARLQPSCEFVNRYGICEDSSEAIAAITRYDSCFCHAASQYDKNAFLTISVYPCVAVDQHPYGAVVYKSSCGHLKLIMSCNSDKCLLKHMSVLNNSLVNYYLVNNVSFSMSR